MSVLRKFYKYNSISIEYLRVFLKGDYSKAKKLLKWKPKFTAKKLIDDMIDFENKLHD